jgi:hypothetical protein
VVLHLLQCCAQQEAELMAMPVPLLPLLLLRCLQQHVPERLLLLLLTLWPPVAQASLQLPVPPSVRLLPVNLSDGMPALMLLLLLLLASIHHQVQLDCQRPAVH